MPKVNTSRLVDPQTLVGQAVRVHLNLTRGDFVICDPTTGYVLAYVPDVTLKDVTFKVRESTRQRVITKGHREVHAWAFGTVVAASSGWEPEGACVTYNPHRAGTFTIDGAPVHHLPVVYFHGRHGFTEATWPPA